MGARVRYDGVEYDVVRKQGTDLALRRSDGSVFGVKAEACEVVKGDAEKLGAQPVDDAAVDATFENEGDALSADEPNADDFDLDEDEAYDLDADED